MESVSAPSWFMLLVVLPLLACSISCLCSMVGVSGAFLLLPLQVFLFGASPSVSATNQLFNLMATPSGIVRYVREGRMLWPLAFLLSAGTLPGLFLGVWMRIVWLPSPAAFSVFVACVLLLIAWNMMHSRRRAAQAAGAHPEAGSSATVSPASGNAAGNDLVVQSCSLSVRSLVYTFNGTQYACSVPALLGLSLVVGIVGGAYGIGGGALLAPFLVAQFRLPVHSLSAATLFSTLFTAVAALGTYSLLAVHVPTLSVAPNLPIGLSLGFGGMAGMYAGARLQRRFSGQMLHRLLTALVCTTSLVLLGRVAVTVF